MTKHLRWLTRPVPGVARGALALSVYAEPDETGAYKYIPAQESGYEGVACVDDAARAAGLFSRIWQTSRRP